MRFHIKKKRYYEIDPEAWRRYFAWKPTRINEETVIWLECVWRRPKVVDEGSWAGGYKYQWIYITEDGLWKSPVIGN